MKRARALLRHVPPPPLPPSTEREHDEAVATACRIEPLVRITARGAALLAAFEAKRKRK